MLDKANNPAAVPTAPTAPYVNDVGRLVTPIRDCFLVVKGTAPRCRKVDTHIVRLGDKPVDVDSATLMPEARARLAAFKNVTRAKLCLHYAEIGDGFKTVVLYDSRHITVRLV